MTEAVSGWSAPSRRSRSARVSLRIRSASSYSPHSERKARQDHLGKGVLLGVVDGVAKQRHRRLHRLARAPELSFVDQRLGKIELGQRRIQGGDAVGVRDENVARMRQHGQPVAARRRFPAERTAELELDDRRVQIVGAAGFREQLQRAAQLKLRFGGFPSLRQCRPEQIAMPADRDRSLAVQLRDRRDRGFEERLGRAELVCLGSKLGQLKPGRRARRGDAAVTVGGDVREQP